MRVGLIGCGHMGAALASRMALLPGVSLLLSNRSEEKARLLAEKTGGKAVDNEETVRRSDLLILGVRPQDLPSLADEIRPYLSEKPETVVVSMAVGVTMDGLEALLGLSSQPLVRIMPNTPSEIGKGVILYTPRRLGEKNEEEFVRLFSRCGEVIRIREEEMDAAGCVSGCGPAYVYRFISAFTEAGEKAGLSKDLARKLAVATVLGSAEMVGQTGETPETLCRQVCSKGGTTERGVWELDGSDFASAVDRALQASLKRTKELKK
ncbi:MAG: pyrroline-5-carboxylate reductase [Clostridia bacterium]|nr:pyrroline-5-carboxylate reductase [Clostridia bacterium]